MELSNVINVWTWNCRSLYNKLTEFKVEVYLKKPHIICLQETFIVDDREPALINYQGYFKNRAGRGGGVAVFVRSDMIVIPTSVNIYNQASSLEWQVVRVKQCDEVVDIMNIYNPSGDTVTRLEFEHYIDQLANKFVLVGDLNAHFPIWTAGSSVNTTGRNIGDLILQRQVRRQLQVITPRGQPTYLDSATGRTSTLDLCIASHRIGNLVQLELGVDLGSDHCPVYIKINLRPVLMSAESRKRWKFRDDKWQEYRDNLVDLPEQLNSVEEGSDQISEGMRRAAEVTFGMTSGIRHPKYSQPWWSEECSVAERERRRLFSIMRRHPTDENLRRWKDADLEVKRVTKERKAESFKEFVNSINSKTSAGTVWSKINSLKRTPTKTNPPIIDNDRIVTTNEDKAAKFAEHFATIFEGVQEERDVEEEEELRRFERMQTNRGYNSPFTLEELGDTVSRLPNTAPGHDNIHNKMIKQLPERYIEFLLKLINKCYSESEIPRAWKIALIIPIPKIGKDNTRAESYRPISLLPCLEKVMERMISERLYWYLERTDKFAFTQGGFRRKLNAVDQVARLEKMIRETLVEKGVCLVTLVDLKSAYDTVGHMKMVQVLCRRGLRGNMLAWLKNFLNNRHFQIMCNGKTSREKEVQKGIPQGSTLSPILFNIFLADNPQVEGVTRLEYADDIALVSRSKNVEGAREKMQEALDSLFTFTQERGLVISHAKTHAMIFTRKDVDIPRLMINNEEVNFADESRYLGMILDSPVLNWKKHLQYIKANTIKRTNIIKAVSNTKWGADREMLMRIYKVIIRTKIAYGLEIYGAVCDTDIKSLDVVQNESVRMTLGARKTSPICSLEVEAHIPPLTIYRNQIAVRYLNRVRCLPSNCAVFQELVESRRRLNYTVINIAPVIERARSLLDNWNIEGMVVGNIPYESAIPPWESVGAVKSEFWVEVGGVASEGVRQQFMDRCETLYSQYQKIFTDGSRRSEPEVAVGAAAVVMGGDVVGKWRLSGDCSVFESEMYAIYRAVKWWCDVGEERAVIFTDSLSCIESLKNRRQNNNYYKYQILREIQRANRNEDCLIIEWLPAHRGIVGNELADQAAKDATNLEVTTNTVLHYRSGRNSIRRAMEAVWNRRWHEQREDRHLTQIKERIEYWAVSSMPRDRRAETVMARLRIGHAGVRAHLYRFGLHNSPLCECGEAENVKHVLVDCELWRGERRHILGHDIMDNHLNIKYLLGGGDGTDREKVDTIKKVIQFLTAIDKINSI